MMKSSYMQKYLLFKIALIKLRVRGKINSKVYNNLNILIGDIIKKEQDLYSPYYTWEETKRGEGRLGSSRDIEVLKEYFTTSYWQDISVLYVKKTGYYYRVLLRWLFGFRIVK